MSRRPPPLAPDGVRLSICMATYRRAEFIGETLGSIIPQLGPGVEVVIVDGASPDDTEAVVAGYRAACPAIRYFRESTNSGVDGDYDKAVGYARGGHCWLVTDDDLLAPGAIDRVLEVLENGSVDLLIVDVEVRDVTLSRTLRTRRIGFAGERTYGRHDGDRFMRDAGDALTFIGGTIVRRALWMARDRASYHGSLFAHVGVIFQAPMFDHARVLAEPLVFLRAGNGMWRPRGFEIWTFIWPRLIWSFEGYSDAAKRAVTPREPGRSLAWLMRYRALGAYSIDEYANFFRTSPHGLARFAAFAAAVFPGRLANVLALITLIVMGRRGGDGAYDLIFSSRFSNPVSRWLAGFAPLGPRRSPI